MFNDITTGKTACFTRESDGFCRFNSGCSGRSDMTCAECAGVDIALDGRYHAASPIYGRDANGIAMRHILMASRDCVWAPVSDAPVYGLLVPADGTAYPIDIDVEGYCYDYYGEYPDSQDFVNGVCRLRTEDCAGNCTKYKQCFGMSSEDMWKQKEDPDDMGPYNKPLYGGLSSMPIDDLLEVLEVSA